jgi:hypothetical protein
MTDRREPREVRPAEILAAAQATASVRGLSQKILQKTDPDGTPAAKVRLGLVVAVDTATWTCTALIGDQLTQVPGIPVLAGVVPVVECAGQFVQVGDQYTLIGMLAKGPAAVRIRKTANQSIFNTGSATADNDLKFYGVAGRSYIFDAMLIVFQNTGTNSLDIKVGWSSLPAGATWSGGGPGPATAIANSLSGTEGPASANWRAAFSTTGVLLPYGVEGSSGVGVDGVSVVVPFQGTIKMGATSGLCTLGWTQNGPATATTTVREGSFLKADMTSEYTL